MANFTFTGRGYFRNGRCWPKPGRSQLPGGPSQKPSLAFRFVHVYACGPLCSCVCVFLCPSLRPPVCVLDLKGQVVFAHFPQ